jgi:hypothetical protein
VTGTYASQVQADLPTPGVGVWERISIAAFMAWIVVLATALLRAPTRMAAEASATPALDRLREVDNRRLVAIEDHTQEARSGLADSVEILPELVPAHLEQFRQRVGAGKRRAC